MPRFDPFPRPDEIDPYVFTKLFLLSAPTQVPKIQAAKSGGVSGHLVDRGLMVLDKKGKMVTGRKHPRMWLARVEQVGLNILQLFFLACNQLTEDSLVLTYPGMEDLFVSLGKGNSVAAEVWGENCDGIDLGDAASRSDPKMSFAAALSQSCSILLMVL